MREERLRQVLVELAEQDIPYRQDVANRLEARIIHHVAAQRTRTAYRLARKQRGVPGLVSVAGVLIILLLGGRSVAYATASAMQRAFANLAPAVATLRPDREFTVTETTNGLTMSLRRVYADGQTVVLGYTVAGTAANVEALMRWTPSLTDGQGRRLSILGGPSSPGETAGAATWLVWFEGLRPSGNGETALHFQQGPFAFDFTVPVAPSAIATPGNVVKSNGWNIALTRVAVAPSGVRVTLRGAGPDADVHLLVGAKQYQLYQPGTATNRDIKECFAEQRACPQFWASKDVDYIVAAMQPAGIDSRGLSEDSASTAQWVSEIRSGSTAWTLVVRPDSSIVTPQFMLPPGYWVFHFTVPT